MKHLILLFTIALIAHKSHAQHIVLYKTESIICNGDTFWKRTFVNTKEKDTTYKYTPDIPEQCITETERGTFIYVEKMPKPNYDLNKYFSDSSSIPVNSDCENSCKLVLSFIVDRTGAIKQVDIVKSKCGKVIDTAALDLIDRMPKWVAGRQGGRPVPVRYTLAICF